MPQPAAAVTVTTYSLPTSLMSLVYQYIPRLAPVSVIKVEEGDTEAEYVIVQLEGLEVNVETSY